MWTLSLKEPIESRLKASPLPYANNRVKEVAKGQYELALRTWRIYYHIDGDHLVIDQLSSGYDAETLAGLKPSKWDDVPIHQEFMKRFSEETL
jgi:tRNA (adenine37-N6)-methyltransferase